MHLTWMIARFALLFIVVGSSACLDPCGNDLIAETYSPRREFKAVVFFRDCGATTSGSTHVSVLVANAALRTAPSWFQSTHPGNAFAGASGAVVQAEWVGRSRLRIAYSADARVFMTNRQVNGVTVEYIATPP